MGRCFSCSSCELVMRALLPCFRGRSSAPRGREWPACIFSETCQNRQDRHEMRQWKLWERQVRTARGRLLAHCLVSTVGIVPFSSDIDVRRN